jgi:hypothetical protein
MGLKESMDHTSLISRNYRSNIPNFFSMSTTLGTLTSSLLIAKSNNHKFEFFEESQN